MRAEFKRAAGARYERALFASVAIAIDISAVKAEQIRYRSSQQRIAVAALTFTIMTLNYRLLHLSCLRQSRGKSTRECFIDFDLKSFDGI